MLAPGVRETTITTGTGTLTLVAMTGSVAFSEAFANGARVCYAIKNGNNWEWGIGTTGASKTLERTIPIVTYVGGVLDNTTPSAITLVGASDVFCTAANNTWMFGPSGITTNTILGVDAGSASASGNNDVAVGGYAQQVITTGSHDVAVGTYAQRSITTGNHDVAVGGSAQYSITTGGYDVAVGGKAQQSITTGNYDTAVGYEAQKNITTGSGNITIGGTTAAGAYAPVNDITTADNLISLGSTAVTAAYVNVAWTVISDERDKTNIKSLPHGLDVIEALSPVQYERRIARDEGGDGILRYGFVAQNVLAVPGAEPVVDARNQDRLGLHSDYIVPLLVRAVQELSARVTALEAKQNG